MKNLDRLMENDTETLSFLRTRFPIYHLSNVFFRDIQYGIQTMLDRKGAKVGYTEAERLAKEFVGRLEKKKIFVPIDRQSWVVYSEDFKTVAPKRPAPVAKAGPATQAAPRPAGGLPSLKSSTPAASLPPLKSSAPAGGSNEAAPAAPKVETPSVESVAPTPAEAAPTPAAKQEPPTPKPQQTAAKRSLPPIKSSTPVGGKK